MASVVSASKLGGAGFSLSITPSSELNSSKIRAAHTSSADLQRLIEMKIICIYLFHKMEVNSELMYY